MRLLLSYVAVHMLVVSTVNAWVVTSCSSDSDCDSSRHCCVTSPAPLLLKRGVDDSAGTCQPRGTNTWDACQVPPSTMFCTCAPGLICVEDAMGNPIEASGSGTIGTCQKGCDANGDCPEKKCCVPFNSKAIRLSRKRPRGEQFTGFCRLRCRAEGSCMEDYADKRRL